MSRKKQPPNHTDAINLILIEELGIQSEEELIPSAKLLDLGAEPDDTAYIAVRLEDELELTIPDGAEEKFITVQDVYDCVLRAAS